MLKHCPIYFVLKLPLLGIACSSAFFAESVTELGRILEREICYPDLKLYTHLVERTISLCELSLSA